MITEDYVSFEIAKLMKTKEAIERIKARFDKWALDNEDLTALQTLGLVDTDSEDERIRKMMIKHFTEMKENSHSSCLPYDNCIAYLEKQKYDRMQPVYNNLDSFESALAKAWKEYNNSGSRTVDGCEDNYVECAHAKGFREGFLYGLEKQKEQNTLSTEETELNSIAFLEQLGYTCVPPGVEQKPTLRVTKAFYEPGGPQFDVVEDKNENDAIVSKFNIGDRIRFKGYGNNEYTISGVLHGYYINTDDNRMDMSYTDANFELIGVEQQSSEWSEEDEKILDSILGDIGIADKKMGGAPTYVTKRNWLESLHPVKQEWSEEDRHAIENCEYAIKETFKDEQNPHRIGTLSWLKSLRPQPHWKPSEYELSLVKRVANGEMLTGVEQMAMGTLYEHLKKL